MERSLLLRNNSVPSGSYVISNKKNEVLNAYLGTCVGVAICDRHNNVGGLIHLLLSEPTAPGNTLGRPENYALTGVPMFIRDLILNGAIKENLEATVAGGVLVGPVSRVDINLDIGGRTTEVVEKILAREGIPIIKRETGGYFSCCLNLNLSDWETSIELINVPDESHETFNKPDNNALTKAMDDVRPIPQNILKIIRMIQDDNYSMLDLSKEVRQEQVIAAKIIRLCNSAFFHQKYMVNSIDRALAVLGEKRLLKVLISASMEDFFPSESGGYSLCKGGIFTHAVETAITAERLAVKTGLVSGDLAYTAGLLHDIGKVALDQYMGLAYPLFYRDLQEKGETLINVEKRIFGATHTEIGGILSERWFMPEQITEVIKYHHAPEQASHFPELTHMVYLADLILSRFMVGNEIDRLDTEHFTSRLNRIGLSPEGFPALIEELSEGLLNLSFPSKS
jgi:putative nucleotidyltransferase with HDIG domain